MDTPTRARRPPLRYVWFGAALLAAWANTANPVRVGGAETGQIRGDVRVVSPSSRKLATPGAYPNRNVAIARRQGGAEVENVVVFVKTATTAPAPATHVSIRQTNEEFLPHVVAVATGSTVDFPNDDLLFHNVFSLSSAGTFDLGRYPRGESRQRVMSKPGIVKVFCHLHAHMAAVVRVFDHPYFTQPDVNGHFEIRGLPPGRHQAVAWHERIGEVSVSLTVEEGRATDVVFSLPIGEGS